MKKILTLILLFTTLNVNSIDNNKIQEFINSWWEVPYKWGGTTRKGIDCSAFIQKLYKIVFDINIPRTCKEQYKYCIKTIDSFETGDLVFFKMGNDKWHVGIYLIEGQFAHASVSKGVWISNLYDDYWYRYYFSSGKVPLLSL